MISPIRFAARYLIVGEKHQRNDADIILKKVAAEQGVKIQILPSPSGSYVFTGPDADRFEQAAQNHNPMAERTDGTYAQHLIEASQNRLSVNDDFATSHYNYQLVFGQPLFDVATGQPIPPKDRASLNPFSVPGNIDSRRKSCIA